MFTLKQIAQKTNTQYQGEADSVITEASSLSSATKNSICFVLSARYLKQLDDCAAGIIIVKEEFKEQLDRPIIISEHPELTFVEVLNLLHPTSEKTGIHASAVIDESVKTNATHNIAANVVIGKNVVLGDSVSIGAGCIIEDDVEIGAFTFFHPRVVICKQSVIGDYCILHPGVVIGSDGFGLTKDALDRQKWLKIPQIGRAIIKNHVEIGANTTVDRGALDDTIIYDGVKLDNQIQVAHNVEIGENTAIAACVGIAGSAKIGKNCQISGAAVVLGHLSVADNVIVTAMSLVTKSIKQSGVYSSGTPLLENNHWHKSNARYKNLDDLAKAVKALQQQQDS